MRESGQHEGVLIAINNTVAIRYAEVSMPDCDFACATLLNSDAGFWLLIELYNPPRNSSYCLEPNVITGCIDHFVSTARGLILSDAPMKLVIVGDFNLPDVNWETYLGSSEYSQTILNYLDSHNLIQNVMEPTHRSGNILDLVFAADDTAVTVANVNLISDYYPNTFDLVLELPIIRGSYSVSVYCKSSFNELCFWWNLSFLHSYCVRRNPKDIAVGDWCCLFNYALMSPISLKRKQRRELPYYYSSHSVHLLNQQSTITRRLQRQWTLRDALDLKRVKLDVTRSIELDETLLLSELGPTSNCLRLLRSIKNKPTPSCMKWHDKVAFADSDKAEFFNSYFASVYSDIGSIDAVHSEPSNGSSGSTILLQDVLLSVDRVDKLLCKINDSSTYSFGLVPPFVLQSQSSNISTSVFLLFRSILNCAIWPDVWKTSIITPIHKKGQTDDVTNYRPISILPKLSLVLERILFDFIYPKVRSKNSRSQFGFMSKKSTVLQLIAFLDNLYKCYDVNEPCFVVYFDIQKAFDTVPHSLLISKLQAYGFDHSFQMLFSSYLTLRQQMVKVNGCLSSKQTIGSGIPQGSVLDPLLFLLFINDMPDVVVHSNCLFADDCKVQGSNPTLVQNDINSVVSWSLRNNLRFHPQKTQVLCFGSTNQFLLSQELIKTVATIDDLVIRVNSNLSWNAHVDWKIGKASRALFNIRSCIPFTTNPQTKLRPNNSLILPILLYGSQAWFPSITSMRSLMTFHFRCLKRVVGSSMDYKTCLQRSNNSLPICYQLILSDQTFLWKNLHVHLDINLPDYIQLNSGYSLVNRHQRTFIMKHCKKRKPEESFFTRASVQANYLSLRNVDILDPSFATYRKNLLSSSSNLRKF